MQGSKVGSGILSPKSGDQMKRTNVFTTKGKENTVYPGQILNSGTIKKHIQALRKSINPASTATRSSKAQNKNIIEITESPFICTNEQKIPHEFSKTLVSPPVNLFNSIEARDIELKTSIINPPVRVVKGKKEFPALTLDTDKTNAIDSIASRNLVQVPINETTKSMKESCPHHNQRSSCNAIHKSSNSDANANLNTNEQTVGQLMQALDGKYTQIAAMSKEKLEFERRLSTLEGELNKYKELAEKQDANEAIMNQKRSRIARIEHNELEEPAVSKTESSGKMKQIFEQLRAVININPKEKGKAKNQKMQKKLDFSEVKNNLIKKDVNSHPKTTKATTTKKFKFDILVSPTQRTLSQQRPRQKEAKNITQIYNSSKCKDNNEVIQLQLMVLKEKILRVLQHVECQNKVIAILSTRAK